ncbi:COesterase and/or Abhydrolase 3 domain containing protein, partial [Asbolus verrucosus]
EPEPVEPWSGVWDANFLTECVQTALMNKSFVTRADEDCLHLNVYVPRGAPNPKENLDVIVSIHGGAYMFGSGHFHSNPQFLMDHDVIFVTFNYRLGILGFLSTEDDVVPGNNGLKDQVLALKWVQENIASFGGNPASVTLTGLSAGGSSVHLHYFSDMSKGLFHRGFSQSGCALNAWTLQNQPAEKAKILAEAVGCPTSPSRSLVQCLKQRPYPHLLARMPLFYGYMMLPIAPFAPVVEKGSKPFLKADPYYLLTEGEVYDVPWIASNTAHEGVIPVILFLLLQVFKDLQVINDEWENLAPILLEYNYTLPQPLWTTTAKKVKEFYLGEGQDISQENMLKVMQIFTDRGFLVGAETAVKKQAKVAKSPIYYYFFAYPGDDNEQRIVSHGIDSKYIYGDDLEGKMLTPNELQMKNVLVDMLISYPKTGLTTQILCRKPTIKGVKWEPTQHDELTYLNIDGFAPENIKLETVKELTPRAFWRSLGFQESENLILIKDEL